MHIDERVLKCVTHWQKKNAVPIKKMLCLLKSR